MVKTLSRFPEHIVLSICITQLLDVIFMTTHEPLFPKTWNLSDPLILNQEKDYKVDI